MLLRSWEMSLSEIIVVFTFLFLWRIPLKLILIEFCKSLINESHRIVCIDKAQYLYWNIFRYATGYVLALNFRYLDHAIIF